MQTIKLDNVQLYVNPALTLGKQIVDKLIECFTKAITCKIVMQFLSSLLYKYF